MKHKNKKYHNKTSEKNRQPNKKLYDHHLLHAHMWESFRRPIAKWYFQYLRNYLCCWRDLEDLQLGVYNFQLLRLCSSVCVVMPCAKLIVDSNPTADFCYLHFLFFFCTSRPLGWPGGTYDTCPATPDVPLHLVLFYALCG